MPAAFLNIARTVGSFIGRGLTTTTRSAAVRTAEAVSGFFNSSARGNETQQQPTLSTSTFLGPLEGLVRMFGVEPGLVYAIAGALIVPLILIYALFQTIIGSTSIVSSIQ
jgi:hypothetical protein